MSRLIIAMLIAITASEAALGKHSWLPTPRKPGPVEAYIVYSAQRSGPVMQFVRDPTPDDLAAYESERDDALKDELAQYYKRYSTKVRETAQQIIPPLPTRSTAKVRPIGIFLTTQGSYWRYKAGNDGKVVFMVAVKPGTYSIYGPVLADNTFGTWGTCLCLGTLRFEIKAGEAVDLGLIESRDGIHATKFSGRWIKGDGFGLPEGTTTFIMQPNVSWAAPGDPNLKGFKLTTAKLHPAGKLPNWYGLSIDRITAIPGILAYDGDKMIDLTK